MINIKYKISYFPSFFLRIKGTMQFINIYINYFEI